MDDPLHPVLARPWEYELVGFDYRALGDEPRVDLMLRRGAEVRRLRFIQPREIRLDPDFSDVRGPSGIAILDVSARRLEGIGVRVSDAVTGHDCMLTFWARKVFLLPD